MPWWPWVDLDHFYEGSNLFLMLLYGWQLIEHWVLLHFQVCSNSACPQHSGERYRANGPLFFFQHLSFLKSLSVTSDNIPINFCLDERIEPMTLRMQRQHYRVAINIRQGYSSTMIFPSCLGFDHKSCLEIPQTSMRHEWSAPNTTDEMFMLDARNSRRKNANQLLPPLKIGPRTTHGKQNQLSITPP